MIKATLPTQSTPFLDASGNIAPAWYLVLAKIIQNVGQSGDTLTGKAPIVSPTFTGTSIRITGTPAASDWTAQGASIGWNYTGGSGETDFVNVKGGGPGGFNFYNAAVGATTVSKMLTIDGGTNTVSMFDATGQATIVRPRSGSLRVGKATMGQGDNGCVLTAIANSSRADGGGPAGVLGYTPGLGALAYGDIDSVTLYAENSGRDPLIVKSNVTFTAGQMSFAVPLTASERALLFNGMNLLTNHTPRWSGFVSSWAADGTSVTLIEGWGVFGLGGQSPGLVPPAGLAFKVAFAPLTKTWGHNTNVFIGTTVDGVAYGEFGAQKIAGFELGIINQTAFDHDYLGDFNLAGRYSWGFDSVNLGPKRGSSAHIARGSWDVGFHSRSGVYAAFLADGVNGNCGVGFFSSQSAGIPFLHQTGGINKIISDTNGNISIVGNMLAGGHVVPTTSGAGFTSLQTSGFSFVHQLSGVNKFTVDTAGNMMISGSMALPGLPSTAPASGSKQLWYDPADGNRVKFVP